MTPEQIADIREKRRRHAMEQVKVGFSIDLKEAQEGQNLLAVSLESIMNNLAIVSGAIAAGSLVLLGFNISADRSDVVSGIIILLVNVVFVFGFLLHNHGKATEGLTEYKEKRLSPVANLITLYGDYLQSKMTGDQFDSALTKAALIIKGYESKSQNELVNLSKAKKNYWDLFFIIILGLGSLLIIVGLLSPYLLITV